MKTPVGQIYPLSINLERRSSIEWRRSYGRCTVYSVHCFSHQALKVRPWNWACCCVVPWKRRESNRCEYRLQIITCFFDLWSKMFTCWQAGTGQRLELGRFQPREEWEREHKLLRVYYYVNEVKNTRFSEKPVQQMAFHRSLSSPIFISEKRYWVICLTYLLIWFFALKIFGYLFLILIFGSLVEAGRGDYLESVTTGWALAVGSLGLPGAGWDWVVGSLH